VRDGHAFILFASQMRSAFFRSDLAPGGVNDEYTLHLYDILKYI